MPDNLNSGNISGSENKTSLSTPQEKSPIEEAAEIKPAPAPQTPVGSPTPKPVEAEQPAGKVNEPQTTPAPDTDEFLKSILDGQTGGTNETPASPLVETPPPKPEPMPDKPTPIEDENALEREVDRGDLLKSDQPSPEMEPPTQPKIKDEVSGMDGIIASRDQKTSFNQPLTPGAGQVGEGRSVSPDFTSSAQQDKPVPGRSNKFLYVVIIIVVVVIGGYSVYSIMNSRSKTTPTVTNLTPVASLSATVSTQSLDQRRKNDLYIIQQALFSYYANSGSKYPVASEMIFLNSPGNILESTLVPDYLGSLPADPDVAKNYAYKSADGTKFELTAILDDETDPEAVLSNGKSILTVTQDSKAPSSAASASPAAQDTALTGDIVSSPVF